MLNYMKQSDLSKFGFKTVETVSLTELGKIRLNEIENIEVKK